MPEFEPMPEKFEALAVYNSERERGIAHTPEWDAKMAGLQREFGDWNRQSWLNAGYVEIGPGVYDKPAAAGKDGKR